MQRQRGSLHRQAHSIELQIDQNKKPEKLHSPSPQNKKALVIKWWVKVFWHNVKYYSAEQLLKIALCFGIHPLLLPLFLSFCMLLAADGDDGMGWIFNRFVSGSTMGGGIVVNIITYRSLRLHFPRPCQTGAITHSSPPHHHHTYTRTPFSWLALTVPVYTISSCLMTLLTPIESCF